jgi:hypothetical protein
MDIWPYCFGPVAEQNIMIETHSGGGLFTSWQSGRKDRARGSGWNLNIPSKDMPPMT